MTVADPTEVSMPFTIGYRMTNPMRAIELAREYLVAHRGYTVDDARGVVTTPDDALEELMPLCPWFLIDALDDDGQPRLTYLRRLVTECDAESIDIYDRTTNENWWPQEDDVAGEEDTLVHRLGTPVRYPHRDALEAWKADYIAHFRNRYGPDLPVLVAVWRVDPDGDIFIGSPSLRPADALEVVTHG